MKVYDAQGLEKVRQTIVPTTFNRGAQWVAATGPVTTPTNDVDVTIPYTCVLKKIIVLSAGGPGSCVIGLWSTPYAGFPPTSSNDITGGANVVLSAVSKLEITSFAGWTTGFNQDDVIRLHLVSSVTFTRVSIQLEFA